MPFTFLTPILVAGALAFAIPLIIHLLNRRKFQLLPWGAMHLLEMSIRQSRRRLRLLELLLLLVRILIPIILALCLARPVMTSMQRFDGQQKTSVVILVDDSFSMAATAGTITAQSAWEEAANAVESVAQALPSGSQIQIVKMGGLPSPLLDDPTTALETAASTLRQTQPSSGPIDLANSIRLASGLFSQMDHSARELIVLSDFRSTDWQPGGFASRQDALASLGDDEDLRPAITLFKVGSDLANNVSIDSVMPSSHVVGVNQRFSLRVTIKNHGIGNYRELPVVVSSGDKEIGTARISLAPKQEAQILFDHQFDAAGDQPITVKFEGDELDSDNVHHVIMRVWEDLPVLLAGNDSGRDGSLGPLQRPTDFLEVALRPFDAAGVEDVGLKDLIRPVTVEHWDTGRDRLSSFGVAILANVARINNPNELAEWVAAGGSLLLFLGDRTDLSWWQRELEQKFPGLMPGRIIGMGGGATGTSTSGARISGHYLHPAVSFFNDPRQGRLADAEFFSWYRLEPITSPAPSVILRLDTGDPLALESRYGRGRVILVASPADTSWGNLPTQPSYLPLAQRLTTYLATGAEADRNLQPGTPLRIEFQENPPAEIIMVDSAGAEHLVPVLIHDRSADGAERAGADVATFEKTGLPGLYTAIIQQEQGAGEEAPEIQTSRRLYAVNFPGAESDLEPITAENLDALVTEFGGRLVGNAQEYIALDGLRRNGNEWWLPLLWILLAFLIAEIFLQQIGTARSRS